ncbi:MAG: hypothetical protein K0R82_1689 [Flavipsychrobacter sp.]|jgi:hypothetical protein|nr:hypothetical protein [Flavipsychrobacter sp.]
MKKLLAILFIAVSVVFFTSCSNTDESTTTSSDSLDVSTDVTTTTYIDPETGATVTRDAATGLYIDASGNPVEFYVDATTLDTFYGKTGQNVNQAIIHDVDGGWRLDESKIKVDEDDVKIEHADGSKTKIEGDKIKVKNADGSKAKMDGDETKVKDGDGKMKSDAEGTKTK